MKVQKWPHQQVAIGAGLSWDVSWELGSPPHELFYVVAWTSSSMAVLQKGVFQKAKSEATYLLSPNPGSYVVLFP